MSKRFTDTDLWKSQRWFRKLPPIYKLAFCYIKDQCNHAGIWKIDCSDLIEDLDIDEFDLSDFVTAVNVEFDKITGKKILKERLRIINENTLWITGFIQYQYEGKDKKVNPQTAPVRTAFIILEGYHIPCTRVVPPLNVGSSVLDYALNNSYLTLTKFLQEGWQTPKDKDKDKDKDSLKKEGAGENNSSTKNQNNGKSFVNFKAQGEEVILRRLGKLPPKT